MSNQQVGYQRLPGTGGRPPNIRQRRRWRATAIPLLMVEREKNDAADGNLVDDEGDRNAYDTNGEENSPEIKMEMPEGQEFDLESSNQDKT